MIQRYDADGDLRISTEEMEAMLVKPANIDLDFDGFLTVEEYAKYFESRMKK